MIACLAIVALVAGCGRLGFDASATDATATDVAIDAIGPPCPPLPGLLFCESFEGDPLLPSVDGTVMIDATRSARGARSQYAMTTGASVPSWQLGQVLPYVTSGELYARWYVWVPSTVQSIDLASVHLVEMTTPYDGVSFGVVDGIVEMENTANDISMIARSTTRLPLDRWVCLQMHVAISATDGAIDVAVDGQTVAARSGLDTLPATGYRMVHAGLFAMDSATAPIEMWTDEVAVGTQPIPCD